MSKTVKRVSKTVKRVMTVMMIGLVAMLGVKAEAHYIVVKGRCVWHSLECYRQDEDVPRPPIQNIPISEIVASFPDSQSVEILCPRGAQPKDPFYPVNVNEMTLAARKLYNQGDYTERRRPGGIISTNTEVQGIISDAIFREDPAVLEDVLDFDFCTRESDGKSVPARDVLIHRMSVDMNLYIKAGNQTILHSRWRARCELPDDRVTPPRFNLQNYDINPNDNAPRGTPFVCATAPVNPDGTGTCHGDCR